jgi:hypothetical protein
MRRYGRYGRLYEFDEDDMSGVYYIEADSPEFERSISKVLRQCAAECDVDVVLNDITDDKVMFSIENVPVIIKCTGTNERGSSFEVKIQKQFYKKYNIPNGEVIDDKLPEQPSIILEDGTIPETWEACIYLVFSDLCEDELI